MTTKTRRIRNAMMLTLVMLIFLCGTLWLCLNVSWWFATLYLLPIVFLVSLFITVWIEIEKDKN